VLSVARGVALLDGFEADHAGYLGEVGVP
jgi:hypothetical protein